MYTYSTKHAGNHRSYHLVLFYLPNSRCRGFIVIEPDIWQWDLPRDLADFIITNLFEQPRLDSSALIRGRLPNDEVSAWLYTANCYQPISNDDHEKFRRAARSRGGGYSMELCEFVVE